MAKVKVDDYEFETPDDQAIRVKGLRKPFCNLSILIKRGGKFIFSLGIILSFLSLTGCSSKIYQFDQAILKEYEKHNRLEKYYELRDRYDESRLVLYLNKESDRCWLVNFVAWLASKIIDLPEITATGTSMAIVYLILKILVWWGLITAGGGGILALLAWLGNLFGGFPGIPPLIMGLIYFGTMVAILNSLIYSIFLGVFGG